MRVKITILILAFITGAALTLVAQPTQDKSELERERQEIQKELKEIQNVYNKVKGQSLLLCTNLESLFTVNRFLKKSPVLRRVMISLVWV